MAIGSIKKTAEASESLPLRAIGEQLNPCVPSAKK
jgi:DNA mismatch repair protein MutS